jgi:hypothetical protein
VASKKSVVWESAEENSREERELEFLLRRPEHSQKNYSSVYAKQYHCVFEAKVVCIFEAKVVCIFVAKLLCILAKQCVGKGGPPVGILILLQGKLTSCQMKVLDALRC